MGKEKKRKEKKRKGKNLKWLLSKGFNKAVDKLHLGRQNVEDRTSERKTARSKK
jgi:hypothetical protein